MKLKLPEWLYLDPTKAIPTDDRDSWGYPKNRANKPVAEPEAEGTDEHDETPNEAGRSFTVRHAGSVAVDLVRRGWNYQGNGVVTAGINNLQYHQTENASAREDLR